MRLPRRVPWASLAELDEVCSWIYSDEDDLDAKVRAVHRLSAWRYITAIPHALESTLSILSVIVQDTSAQGLAQGSSSLLPLRQAYASAIVRLVNGLVDPLQFGAYARSISSIAAQLGLPAWLVELRHAATHEDLPSLEVLREAARESMTWLLHNYFIPALNPSTAPTAKAPELRPPTPLIAEYKNVLKITTRDASLRTQYKPEITRILREIERWVAEAKLAADVTVAMVDSSDAQAEEDGEGEDSRERWALDKLCEYLLEKGGLIPVSKKKRSVSNAFEPAAGVIAVWEPLLKQMSTLHPLFPTILVSKITSTILNAAEADGVETEDGNITLEASATQELSYQISTASWANWLLTRFEDPNEPDDEEKDARRLDTVVALIAGLGRADSNGNKAAHHLLKVLCADDSSLQDAATLLLRAPVASSPNWQDGDLNTMAERLDALIDSSDPQGGADADDATTAGPSPDVPDEAQIRLPVGWRLLGPRDGWKPTPIGVPYTA